MSKVVIERLTSKDNLKNKISNMIETLGGIHNYLTPGDTLLIKPNLVTPRTAEEGVTTDPEIIVTLAEIALEAGASRVFIGDSSSQGCNAAEILSNLGLSERVDAGKVELVDFNEEPRREIELKHNHWLKTIRVPEVVTKVNRIWNVPKAKTHYVDKLTCAVKNYVGFIPVEKRLSYHQTGLSHLVASLHKEIKSDLNIVDAIYVGEGEGPNLVEPRKLDVLLVGDDPVAIDSVVGEIFGFDFRELEFAMNAYNLGVGEIELSKIDISGIDLDTVKFQIKRSCIGIIGRYKPVNLIIGGACMGCLTWVKGELEGWFQNGTMDKLMEKDVNLTIMMGFNAVDERFAEHLEEGAYMVIGDCTPEKYHTHSKVIFVPGCCPGINIPQATNSFLRNNCIL